MKLKALSLPDLEQVRQWRNEQTSMLRTPFLLTQEQQETFYRDVVSNRQANARYWGIREKDILIGMSGIENIQWENRLGEISLLLIPGGMRKYGTKALKLLLHKGFMNMNMENIFAEVYECNPHLHFWMSMVEKYDTCFVRLPNRKYYNGEYWSSYYINFNKEAYLERENTLSQPIQMLN